MFANKFLIAAVTTGILAVLAQTGATFAGLIPDPAPGYSTAPPPAHVPVVPQSVREVYLSGDPMLAAATGAAAQLVAEYVAEGRNEIDMLAAQIVVELARSGKLTGNPQKWAEHAYNMAESLVAERGKRRTAAVYTEVFGVALADGPAPEPVAVASAE
jgi:hypothetical protein